MVFTDDSTKKASSKDFSGSFDAGSGTDIATYYVNQNAQMILPVAGPQTGDVAGVIASTGNKGKVFTFGVDVDQSKVYNSDYFLGSAIKGIYVSNAFALSELLDKTNTGVHAPFKQFNMNFADTNVHFKTFVSGLYKKLTSLNKYTESEIKVMLKPTGFAPSASMESSIILDEIYIMAKTFVKGKNVVPSLEKGDKINKNANAKNAFDTFGGYGEVANHAK